MNPIVAWILAHDHAAWLDPYVRAGYTRTYGPVTDDEWDTGLTIATNQWQTATDIATMGRLRTLGRVLGVPTGAGLEVTVQVRITQTDAAGHRQSFLLDVILPTTTRGYDLDRLVIDALHEQQMYAVSSDAVFSYTGVTYT